MITTEIKAAIKAYWAPGLFFEELDLAYLGVIDGHDVGAIREALREGFEAERPVVVHIHTVKGKGFAAAEEGGLEGMEEWHAAKPGSIVDRKPAKSSAPSPVAGAPVGGGTPPRPIPVQESDAPDSIAPEKLETPPPKPSSRICAGRLMLARSVRESLSRMAASPSTSRSMATIASSISASPKDNPCPTPTAAGAGGR